MITLEENRYSSIYLQSRKLMEKNSSSRIPSPPHPHCRDQNQWLSHLLRIRRSKCRMLSFAINRYGYFWDYRANDCWQRMYGIRFADNSSRSDGASQLAKVARLKWISSAVTHQNVNLKNSISMKMRRLPTNPKISPSRSRRNRDRSRLARKRSSLRIDAVMFSLNKFWWQTSLERAPSYLIFSLHSMLTEPTKLINVDFSCVKYPRLRKSGDSCVFLWADNCWYVFIEHWKCLRIWAFCFWSSRT